MYLEKNGHVYIIGGVVESWVARGRLSPEKQVKLIEWLITIHSMSHFSNIIFYNFCGQTVICNVKRTSSLLFPPWCHVVSYREARIQDMHCMHLAGQFDWSPAISDSYHPRAPYDVKQNMSDSYILYWRLAVGHGVGYDQSFSEVRVRIDGVTGRASDSWSKIPGQPEILIFSFLKSYYSLYKPHAQISTIVKTS
jgi:hypothetical protein